MEDLKNTMNEFADKAKDAMETAKDEIADNVKEVKEAVSEATEAPKHTAEPQEKVVIKDNRHRVNKVIYFLLAFFFGTIGAHKFYAGRVVTGILFLLFAFIGWLFTFVLGLGLLLLCFLEVVAFIQGIIVLMKPTGEDGLVEA